MLLMALKTRVSRVRLWIGASPHFLETQRIQHTATHQAVSVPCLCCPMTSDNTKNEEKEQSMVWRLLSKKVAEGALKMDGQVENKFQIAGALRWRKSRVDIFPCYALQWNTGQVIIKGYPQL